MKNNQFYVRFLKYIFFMNLIEYLEYIIDEDELRSNLQLVQALVNFSQFKILKKLQSFLEFMNYYRKFITNFSQIILSLINIIQNNT